MDCFAELETDAPPLCLYLIHRFPIFSFVIPSTGVAFISDNLQHEIVHCSERKYCIIVLFVNYNMQRIIGTGEN